MSDSEYAEEDKKESAKSKWEQRFYQLVIEDGLEEPLHDYRFHPTRRWRFDWCYPERMIAIEIEGGNYGRPVFCQNCGSAVKEKRKDGRWIPVRSGGRHNRPGGYNADTEKYNEAELIGWTVLRFTPESIRDKSCLRVVRKALGAELE